MLNLIFGDSFTEVENLTSKNCHNQKERLSFPFNVYLKMEFRENITFLGSARYEHVLISRRNQLYVIEEQQDS